MLTDMIGQRRGGGLPVAARDTDDPAAPFVAICQLYLTDDRYPFFPDLLHPFVLLRYPRALHHFIGIQDLFRRMPSFFKADPCLLQVLPVVLFHRAAIGDEYGISFLLSQQRRADTTLTTAQYDHAFAHSCFGLIVYNGWRRL